MMVVSVSMSAMPKSQVQKPEAFLQKEERVMSCLAFVIEHGQPQTRSDS